MSAIAMNLEVIKEAQWIMDRAVAVECMADDETYALFNEFKGNVPPRMVNTIERWMDANGGTYDDGRKSVTRRVYISVAVAGGAYSDEYLQLRRGVGGVTFHHIKEVFALAENEIAGGIEAAQAIITRQQTARRCGE